MSKLRKRIETLSSSTSSLKAIELCKEALNKLTEYTTNFRITPSILEQVETTVGQALVEGLAIATDKDDKVTNFIITEKRIIGINNLGVREAIIAVKSTEIYSHPSLRYIAESLSQLDGIPEYLVAQTVIEKLSSFSFDPTVASHVSKIQENVNKYAEDIRIYTAVKQINETKSSFLYSSFEKQLDEYLDVRTAVNRAKLLEALSKFSYDATVRNLHNIVLETSTNFNIQSTSDSCVTEKVYSPVIVNENAETFNVHGKFFTKTGVNITPLTETQVNELPAEFVFLSKYLNQSTVKITENSIAIYNRDKKIIISESNGVNTISINDRTVSPEEFTKIYMNAGVFRRDEISEMANIQKVVDNWDSLMELNFVQTLRSKIDPAVYVDIFKIDETIHINKVNPVMNENVFFPYCTATQSRAMVLEYLNYDLATTFKSILPKEDYKIATLTEKKKEYLTAITSLEEKKSLLENHTDPRVKNSSEVKEIIIAITEEINNLKAEYFEVQSKINAITEGIGFAVGDEAESSKKKVKIIGINQASNTLTIQHEDGSTESVPAKSITKTKGISEPSKNDPTKIVSQFDGMSVAIKEKKELNEYGVYNSETDINNNPKTGENKPDKLSAFFGKVIERLKDITTQLSEVNEMIKENDTISPKSIEICVAELETYVKSLEDETAVTNTSGVELNN